MMLPVNTPPNLRPLTEAEAEEMLLTWQVWADIPHDEKMRRLRAGEAGCRRLSPPSPSLGAMVCQRPDKGHDGAHLGRSQDQYWAWPPDAPL